MTTIPGTTPYAWPFDGAMDLNQVAAVRVVAGPGTGTAGPERDRADEVVDSIRRAGGAVIHVVTAPPPRGAHPSGDDAVPEADHIISAHGIDGFYGSPLDATLRSAGLDRLILVGDGLETCVHSTLRSANDRGYECLLVLDACRPHQPELVAASRSQIEMSGGIFGAVAIAGDVCHAFDHLATVPVPTATPAQKDAQREETAP